jgi:DNA-binding NarL/FixJ family response regulator
MKLISKNSGEFEHNLHPLGHFRRLYFLCERSTGAAHCQVKSGLDGTFPLEEASSLLAMQCMGRGRLPEDYVVMAQADENDLKGLFESTEKLLQASLSLERSVELTHREQQVLAGLVRALANKEIAASLNVCVRTVKFHVSSLLAKFHVRGRMELVREVTQGILGLLAMQKRPTTATHNRSDGGEA